jgi:hypothetical protein
MAIGCIEQVVYLAAITVDCNVLVVERLYDEVADDSAIVLRHPSTIAVEDSCHSDLYAPSATVVEA